MQTRYDSFPMLLYGSILMVLQQVPFRFRKILAEIHCFGMRVEFLVLVMRIIISFILLLADLRYVLEYLVCIHFLCRKETILLPHHLYPESVKHLWVQGEQNSLAWFSCSPAVGTKAAKNSKEDLSGTWAVTESFVMSKVIFKGRCWFFNFFFLTQMLLNCQYSPYHFSLKFTADVLNKHCIHTDMCPSSEIGYVL